MVLGRVLLFLAGAFPFTLLGAAAEPHRLQYNLTVLSRDGSVQSGFLAEGHLDGQLFLLCDRQKCPAGPQGQWAEAVVRAEPWHREIEDLRENAEDLRMMLADITGQKALHSLQEIRRCEIHEDGSTRSFRDFYYDAELFLSQNLVTQEWTVPQSSTARSVATNIMNVWGEDAMKAGTVRANCLWKLRRHLESRAGIRTVPPMVNVTRRKDSDGNTTATCLASSVYPQNITLTWRRDGVSLSQDDQQLERVLPDGNGTYQTRVTIRIRQGEEQRFTCYMEHSGNHSTHPVPPGEESVLPSQWSVNPYITGVTAALVLAAAAAAISYCVCHYKKKRTLPAQHPELVSLQVLDQHVVETRDHRDAAQPGFQPLMSAPGPAGSTEGTEILQPGS
ncbi:MHC class I polypeptide-related sequence B-like [Saimiri boliviensis]|uniref:MHC class I polypeptide-related sequence B-like n=1 Tax=Saimiri boliviensis TaxID=27679 RepID=UPI003D783BBD